MSEKSDKIAQKSCSNQKLLEFSFLAAAILLGFCRMWAGRNGFVDIDGISYIDIGRAYLRGDWNAALNPVWSPLYSWVLGAALRVLRPSLYWEFPVVQSLNFIIYLFTLLCFRFLLVGLMDHSETRGNEFQQMNLARIPKSVWVVLGYTIFMVASLEMVEVTNVRPDMCVAAFFFLASGIVVRIHTVTPKWRMYFLLGVCLGVGYLAKAVLLPLSFAFIVASLVVDNGIRKGVSHLLAALLGLGIVAGPYVALLSKRQGHFTFSETARLNYVWFVNNVSEVEFMSDNAPGYGHPLHPLRRICDHPVVFEFAGPVPGTYPVNFDAAYWWAGVKPHFHFIQQLRRFATGLHELFGLLFSEFQIGLFTGTLALFLFGARWRLIIRRAAGSWFVLLPPIAGLMMYASVYVLPRYVGSFFAVFWLGIVSVWALPDLPQTRRVLTSIAGAIAVTTMLVVLGSTYEDMRTQINLGPVEWRVAEYLRQVGIRHGDHVGRLELGYNLGWALLDGLRVTSEVDLDPGQAQHYMTASDEVKAEVLQAMFRTGVKAIVSDHIERAGCKTGWHTVDKTDYSVCIAPAVSKGVESLAGQGDGN